MEFKDVVEERRSVRSYLDREVTDQAVMELLRLGHMAPTAGNIQPWEFIVVREEAQRRAITDTTFRGNNFDGDLHQDWMMEAPVFIVLCANRQIAYDRYREKALKTLIYLDLSACVENILLGAVDMGLASCYISGFKEDKLARVLDLPDTHEAVAVLPIGYGASPGVVRPKKVLESLVHQERFSAQGGEEKE